MSPGVRRRRCIGRQAIKVAPAVRIAADHGAALTVRGGGHNVAGRSVLDGALQLDLSQMRQVAVHGDARIATVQGGALWHDVDLAAAEGISSRAARSPER